MRKNTRFEYTGRRTAEISFPLGGIGSGCVGLAGNGRLIDWEIFNKPNKGGLNGFSHFAVKAEHAGALLDARVVQGDLLPPYSGGGSQAFQSFGFGPNRATMAGLPHFRDVRFAGEFPLAQLTFDEPEFPGRVRLSAFNPFIPLNDRDSSIPAAFFTFEVTNTTDRTLDYTLAFTVQNPHATATVNRVTQDGGLTLMPLGESALAPDAPEAGGLCIGTDAPTVSLQQYWFRGAWFDNLGVWWRDFTAPGVLENRTYPDGTGGHDHASLAARVAVPAGGSAEVRFILAWHYPNMTNYWSPVKPPAEGGACGCRPATWKNYYATLFEDACAAARYGLANWERLHAETVIFKETLFASTLPDAVLDAVSANISILKSPTVLRLEDGSFYGFEGCHCAAGCCEGSCQHVWNYAYALPFLFPKLERSMRELDYRCNMREDGGMAFRLQLPVGRERSSFRPCADGQFGGVLKVYREWKISGDTTWLKQWWPAVKKSIEFAWAPTNADRWDPNQTGVLWGRQHHTLDMELFGPNAWLTGFYLGALKAGAEMADVCGEPATAKRFRELFAAGKGWTDRHLFNGEYYHQQLDLRDRSVLEPYSRKTDERDYMPGEAYDQYWDAEHGEIKYQVLEGCGIDQVLAQWHANLIGLGEIFDPRQTRLALRAIHTYNHKRSMRDFANFCRLYCLNDEAGTVMFDWPKGKYKPTVPVPYAEETMHGFEYQAACHMIQEGMVKEGIELVKAVRDRYDGERRNPWNEIECGSNYARSMASYALLNAFSGFRFDMTRREVGFRPVRVPRGGFRCFWSLESGWGEIRADRGAFELRVIRGELALDALLLSTARRRKPSVVTLGGRPLSFTRIAERLAFASTAAVRPGADLAVRFEQAG
jgi:uncharacterized protein (DUF608 family)